MAETRCDFGLINTSTQPGYDIDGGDNCQAEAKASTLKFNINIKTENLSDIVFVVGEKEERIVSHKILLALSNNVFKRMFVDPGVHKNDKILKIPDEKPDAFKKLLLYILIGVAKVTTRNMFDMFHIAVRYEVNELAQLSLDYIIDHTEPQTLFDVLQFNRDVNNEKLNKMCFEIFLNDPLIYLSSEKYDGVSKDIIKLISQNTDDAQLTERQLFIAAMKWSQRFSADEPCDENAVKVFKEFVLNSRESEIQVESITSSPASKQMTEDQDSEYSIAYLKSKSIVSGIFQPQDISILGIRIKKTILLKRINYFLGSTTHAGQSQAVWLVICEHLQQPSQTNTFCKVIFKQKIEVTYSNHLKNENFQFDDIILEAGKSYGIQFLFHLNKVLRPNKQQAQIERYHLSPSHLVALNDVEHFHIIPDCNYTNNVIINSVYYSEIA